MPYLASLDGIRRVNLVWPQMDRIVRRSWYIHLACRFSPNFYSALPRCLALVQLCLFAHVLHEYFRCQLLWIVANSYVDVSRSANMWAQSVNLIHSVLWEGECITQARGCLRHEAVKAGHFRGDIANLLPSTLASHLITHNGNICRPLAQTATCRYHDEETSISQKTVDRSVRQ